MKKYSVLLLLSITLFSCKKNKISNQVPMDPTMVAYYPLDANAKDYTKYENHGVIYAPVTSDRKNQNNRAYQFEPQFNGTMPVPGNSFFQSKNIPITLNKQYTFSCWIKMNAYVDGMSVLELTKDQKFQMNPQVWQFRDSLFLTTCTDINNRMLIMSMKRIKYGTETPQWTHLLWTVSSDTTTLYVNGILKETRKMPWPNFQNVDLTLGNSGNNAVTDWGTQGPHQTPSKVSVDEVRIYNRVLNSTEIKKLSE